MLFMRSRHLEPTEHAGMPDVVSVILGVVRAAFGGVLRDVVCNEIPPAFADPPLWGALLAAAGTATSRQAGGRTAEG